MNTHARPAAERNRTKKDASLKEVKSDAADSRPRVQKSDGEEVARKRLGIELTEQGLEKLAMIRKLSEASSNTEVVKNALRVYDYLLRHANEGWKVCLVRDTDSKELILF